MPCVQANADTEPAQQYASQINLSETLINLLSQPSITEYAPIVNYFCRILALLISQDGEAARASFQTVEVLLGLASQPPFRDDVEDFTSIVSVAVAYLGNERFQTDMVTKNQVMLFLDIFHHAYTGFVTKQKEDPDAAGALKQLRSGLLNSLADISAHDAFSRYHPLESDVAQSLLAWLKGANVDLRTAACLSLGNLSRSDEASTALVQKYSAHKPLIDVITDPAASDQQTLHSALSFLKNLAIPASNKPLLSDLLDSACVPRMYALDTSPQVQFSAVSLTRLLITNCPENARRICESLNNEDANEGDNTTANAIISLYGRSDAEPTRMEAARSILALCRALHSSSPESVLADWKTDGPTGSSEEKRSMFYRKHAVAKPLSFMIAQEKWPTMRSEALFVLALMCRSKDGSGVIFDILDDDHMKIIVEVVTGQKSMNGVAEQAESGAGEDSSPDDLSALTTRLQLEPQQVEPGQQATMKKVDRENCLVLVTELLKHQKDEMEESRVRYLGDLIKQALNG